VDIGVSMFFVTAAGILQKSVRLVLVHGVDELVSVIQNAFLVLKHCFVKSQFECVFILGLDLGIDFAHIVQVDETDQAVPRGAELNHTIQVIDQFTQFIHVELCLVVDEFQVQVTEFDQLQVSPKFEVKGFVPFAQEIHID